MRKLFLLLVCSGLMPIVLPAQEIRTIIPGHPVTIGSAFQVQFVMTDPPEKTIILPASFDSFQLVSGPHIYEGKSVLNGVQKKIRNIAYTLVPLSIGRQKISGISIQAGNGYVKSNDVSVIVISQPRASFNVQSSYTDVSLYAPSSKKDLDQLIDGNLFLRTEVSKRQCLQGEPLVATFKLYSRLQSSSEVMKSPAFYGFTAIDMLDINKPHPSVETIGGKVFNVSILRKVQLYPVQSGKQMIDAMNVSSEIEFRDSLNPERKILMKKDLQSSPIVIQVKPLPPNKPPQFSGAVGKFFMETSLQKSLLGMNEEGKLYITIRGSGDFLQVGQPAIKWPSHIDVFELPVQEQIKKDQVPLKGERTYGFSFTAGRPGEYELPPVEFSFFDPSVSKYQVALSDTIRFSIHELLPTSDLNEERSNSQRFPFLVAIILGGVAIIGFILWKYRNHIPAAEKIPVKKDPHYEELENLPVGSLSEKESCLQIRRILFDYLKKKSGISSFHEASRLISKEENEELNAILQECEWIGYSTLKGSSESLKKRAMKLVKGWESSGLK